MQEGKSESRFHLTQLAKPTARFEVIKLFMRNSAEHEISNAHKYKQIKKFCFLSGSDKPIILFFMLLNVKMSIFVDNLTFMGR